jgi:hypothetical protein
LGLAIGFLECGSIVGEAFAPERPGPEEVREIPETFESSGTSYDLGGVVASEEGIWLVL